MPSSSSADRPWAVPKPRPHPDEDASDPVHLAHTRPRQPISHVPHDVTVPLTPLIGREAQVEAVGDLLRGSDVRLVTLTGPGGVGKTRLAVQVATDAAEHFPGGVWFVSLASIADPAFVASSIAQALGVREAGDEPLIDRLTARVGGQRMLLVLDNFEQVIGAAPLLVDLLGSCPGLSVLATSRSRLRVSGEYEYAVPPLGLTVETEALHGFSTPSAVRLFVERARAVKSDFTLTAENAPIVVDMCRRLDGLPLAIELGAARVKVLSLPALLARLERRLPLLTGGPRDMPERQRTMRGAVAWSHDLLGAEDQRLFRLHGVFAGGFTLAAAEAVAAGDGDIFDGIASLIDSSLLRPEVDRPGEPRFAMLETVREFALERLDASGEEAATRNRHAAYFLTLVEQVEPKVIGPDGRTWLAVLDREHDNLRAVLAWSVTSGQPATILRLSGALWRFWYAHGHHGEGRAWLRTALAVARTADLSSRAKASVGAAMLEHSGGDQIAALARGEEGLALYRRLHDRTGTAVALYVLGRMAEANGEYDRAEIRFNEAVTLFRSEHDLVWTGLALDHLGSIAYGRGEHERAKGILSESLALQVTTGHGYGAAVSLLYLGHLALTEGDHATAARRYGESLVKWREEDFRPGIPEVLSGLASVAAARGMSERAVRLFGAAEFARQAIGLPAGMPEQAMYDRGTTGARHDLGEAGFAAAWRTGQAMSIEPALVEAAAVAAEIGWSTDRPGDDDTVQSEPHLTSRELDVLRLLIEGRSDKEIADALFISPRTVQTHITNLFAKLGVNRRAAAASAAVRHGLI